MPRGKSQMQLNHNGWIDWWLENQSDMSRPVPCFGSREERQSPASFFSVTPTRAPSNTSIHTYRPEDDQTSHLTFREKLSSSPYQVVELGHLGTVGVRCEADQIPPWMKLCQITYRRALFATAPLLHENVLVYSATPRRRRRLQSFRRNLVSTRFRPQKPLSPPVSV